MDTRKVKERKIEYVMTLRTVLREMGSVNRSAENLEAIGEIEAALNGTLIEGPHQPELPMARKDQVAA